MPPLWRTLSFRFTIKNLSHFLIFFNIIKLQVILSALKRKAQCMRLNYYLYVYDQQFQISWIMNLQSQQCLMILFRNSIRTFNSILQIKDERVFKNKKKELEGEYRRFQAQKRVTPALILYYNNQIQKLSRVIVSFEKLDESRTGYDKNPFVKRFQNYQINRKNREKVSMKSLLEE